MKPYFPCVVLFLLALIIVNDKDFRTWPQNHAGVAGVSNNWAATLTASEAPFRSSDSHNIQPSFRMPNADCSYPRPLQISYGPGLSMLSRKGSSLEVKTDAEGRMRLGKSVYRFEQLHFHSPGTQLINGQTYPLVAYLVHSNQYGEQVIIAIPFTAGAENPVLTQLFTAIPEYEDEERTVLGFNVADLYPGRLDYNIYLGPQDYQSFSQDIKWLALKSPVNISIAQLKKFKKTLPKINTEPAPLRINLTTLTSG